MNKKEYVKYYYMSNKEKFRDYHKKWYQNNKDKVKKYRLAHKTQQRLYEQKRRNTVKRKEWCKAYRQKNHLKWVEYNRKYRLKHRLQSRDYERNRRHRDSLYRIKYNLRLRLRYVLKFNKKLQRTDELIGCSTKMLNQHLEKQFTLGMNWKNYGYGWHVDHIIPCCEFDLSKEEEQRKCFHYTNLQPLWASENLFKSNKKTQTL